MKAKARQFRYSEKRVDIGPEGTAEISRLQAQRSHRLNGQLPLSAPKEAVENVLVIGYPSTPAGVRFTLRLFPGAALRLPPANFQQPSGLLPHPGFQAGENGETSQSKIGTAQIHK